MDINTQATIPVTELGNFSKLSNIIKEFGKAIVIADGSLTIDDSIAWIKLHAKKR